MTESHTALSGLGVRVAFTALGDEHRAPEQPSLQLVFDGLGIGAG
jgi:hypothetical protein